MSDRLDGFAGGRAVTFDAATAAGLSTDGEGRGRVSGTVESIRYRGVTGPISADAGGERFVEQSVATGEPFEEGRTVEPSGDQDDPLVIGAAGNTMWC